MKRSEAVTAIGEVASYHINPYSGELDEEGCEAILDKLLEIGMLPPPKFKDKVTIEDITYQNGYCLNPNEWEPEDE